MKFLIIFTISITTLHSYAEGKVTINFKKTEESVNRGKNTIEVTVAVLSGNIEKNQVIHLEVVTEDGTAKANVDYKPFQIPITLSHDVTSVKVEVEILSTSSANREFYIRLTNTTSRYIPSSVTISGQGVEITITELDAQILTYAVVAGVLLLIVMFAAIAIITTICYVWRKRGGRYTDINNNTTDYQNSKYCCCNCFQ